MISRASHQRFIAKTTQDDDIEVAAPSAGEMLEIIEVILPFRLNSCP